MTEKQTGLEVHVIYLNREKEELTLQLIDSRGTGRELCGTTVSICMPFSGFRYITQRLHEIEEDFIKGTGSIESGGGK